MLLLQHHQILPIFHEKNYPECMAIMNCQFWFWFSYDWNKINLLTVTFLLQNIRTNFVCPGYVSSCFYQNLFFSIESTCETLQKYMFSEILSSKLFIFRKLCIYTNSRTTFSRIAGKKFISRKYHTNHKLIS